jgi:hypothetical protein
MRTFIRAFEAVENTDAEPVFDPETVDILVAAFDDAWQSITSSGIDLTSEERIQLMRSVLAVRILELARTGERDLHRLREAALLDLARTTRPNILPKSK